MSAHTIAPVLPADMHLPAHARVWQYVADRQFSQDEEAYILGKAKQFTTTWTAHNNQLAADACVLFHQILVLAVDESQAGASGCSIDKSTHFVEELGAQLGIDFFIRDLAFLAQEDGTIQRCKLSNIGGVDASTLVFNTVAANVDSLTQGWKPISESWHKRWL